MWCYFCFVYCDFYYYFDFVTLRCFVFIGLLLSLLCYFLFCHTRRSASDIYSFSLSLLFLCLVWFLYTLYKLSLHPLSTLYCVCVAFLVSVLLYYSILLFYMSFLLLVVLFLFSSVMLYFSLSYLLPFLLVFLLVVLLFS